MSCRRAQGSSWAAARRLEDSYWAMLADGGADEAQTEARAVIGAGELEYACMTKSERGAYLRPRLKQLGEGSTGRGGPQAIAASICLLVESSNDLNSWG